MAVTPAQFIETLERLHLLEPGQLDEIKLRAVPAGDAASLLRDLSQRGWLTAFQADLLQRGSGQELLLGSYVLLDKLGDGGSVFRARNWKLRRLAAVKLIRKEQLASEVAVKRFHREIRALAQLDHPNLVRAYDADEVDGRPFFAMEFVDGIDLERLVREHGPLPPGLACEYIRQAAVGLQHAHERGLVHRNLKPSNLLLARNKDTGTIKVLDLGLALQFDRPSSEQSITLTQLHTTLGTPDYMAPEQSVAAHRVDIRADLYSLGCSLYYLLTGKVPFPGNSVADTLLKHQMEQPEPIESLRRDVPEAVAAICRKLMEKKPENRLQTPADLVAALEPLAPKAAAASSGGAPLLRAIVAKAAPKRASRPGTDKSRRLLLASAVALVMVLCFLVVLIVNRRTPASQAGNSQAAVKSDTSKKPKSTPVKAKVKEPERFALAFDGEASHVSVPNFRYQGNHPLTLEAWVVPRQVSGDRAVFCDYEYGGVGLGIEKGSWAFTMHNGRAYQYAIGGRPALGERVHVAGVYDEKKLTIYVDGKARGRCNWSGKYRASRMAFMIGCNPGREGITNRFDGIIDEVRASRVARYSGDFTPAARFEPDDNTILLYHFDEGQGEKVHDASPKRTDGAISGALWVPEFDMGEPRSK